MAAGSAEPALLAKGPGGKRPLAVGIKEPEEVGKHQACLKTSKPWGRNLPIEAALQMPKFHKGSSTLSFP